MDSAAIPGWDKVNRLAEALLKLGSFVTNLEVSNIKRLYDDLDEFDRRGLKFSPRFKKGKGRFHKSKNRSAHIGVESMARYFVCFAFRFFRQSIRQEYITFLYIISSLISQQGSCAV